MITAEVICQSIFGFSLFVTEEVSGYLLVAIVFLGMPLTLAEGSLFRVEFLMGKASRTGQEILLLVFNLLSLGVAVILDAQLIDLVIGSWARGVEASTVLATPLYIPQTVMVVGMTMVVLVLLAQILRGIASLLATEQP